MAMLKRRDFMKLAGAAAAGLATGAVGIPVFERLTSGPKGVAPLAPGRPPPGRDRIDYRKAKAIPTVCFGCTTACGVIGWVQDGRVRRIEGNPLEPNARGKICAKANGMIHYTYYPERLLYPLKRVGPRGAGQWKRISWDEALDEIAGRMRTVRESGHPERFVFHYGRDKTKGFTSRFTDAFGTPNRLNRRSICSSNRRVPLMSFYGREFEWETQDFLNTQFVVNFGANPMEAYQGGLFMMQRIQEARIDHGAKMVTFEVRPSATASVSDEYFPVMPGTDGAVAAAMVHVILRDGLEDVEFWNRWVNVPLDPIRERFSAYTPEWAEAESGVPAEAIERIARDFAAAAPRATTLSNRGSAKHYNGVQADRIIRMLDPLVGSVGRPGGFCLSSLRMWAGRYGQEGLPKISQPQPRPPKPAPWRPGTPQFEALAPEVQARVAAYPERWQKKYFGELATPSEYPLSFHWYNMRVGQLVQDYIQGGRAQVEVYMSYTYGAAYGYPEAKLAREVFLDESLIPFHVAIDIGYGEQAALADIILPEATSLERWDAHSQNAYNLRPYTAIRQPLVPPPGEARSVQIILRDLARRIGGGMEQYFDFEDVEDFYREWYKNVPIEWAELKRRGVWTDEDRPLDYELYERPVPASEMANASIDRATGIVYADASRSKAIGILQDGEAVRGFDTPTRKIQVLDEIFQEAAAAVDIPLDDPLADPLPIYHRIPGHDTLGDDRMILTTFKWNVHTQGRSGHLKYQAEIVHTNPLFMHPATGRRMGIEDGDTVEVTTFRPEGYTYRAGEKEPVGSFEIPVRFLEGIHPRVVAAAHHVGHWQHGAVGKATVDANSSKPDAEAHDASLADTDIPERIWWATSRGGSGGGVHINDALPINPAPMVGGQNWYDNVCQVRKV